MKANIPETNHKRVVIIGGGFGGLKLARQLSNSDYQVVLIDKNNYHQFQPLFYQVATSGLEPSSISFPFRKIFQKNHSVVFRVANVTSVEPAKNILITDIGEITYDYLVIATGANTNFFGNENFRKYGLPMKNVSEALKIRNMVLQHYEDALTADNETARQALMNIVIVGGGPTGVEIAGTLADMRRFILPKDYPELDFSMMKIHLLEASPRLLNGMADISGIKASEYLQRLGVSVKVNTRVKDYDGNTVQLGDGQNIESRTLIWAAGVAGNIVKGISEDLIIKNNRIKVDRNNKVEGTANIYAIGDIAYMTEEKYPNGHPQVAQVAIQQAECLAKNFENVFNNKALTPFHYKDLGSMATVGRNLAVVDLPAVKFNGFLAWLIWMFVHLMSIVGTKNRLFIFINWMWNYITYDQSLRLIIKPPDNKQV